MGLATGVALADPVAVIDALQTELIAQNWTIDNNIPGGLGTRELYFSKAAGDTFNGEQMTFGIWAPSASRLEISGSQSTYAVWTNGGTELISTNFANPPTDAANVLRNSASSFWETRVEDMNPGANYIRHWIFTPVDTSTGGTPADRQYVYMTIEVSTGLYRSFFFGEIEKYDGDAWQGGQFFEGNTFDNVASTRAVKPFGGAFSHNVFQQNRGLGAVVYDMGNAEIITPGNNNFVTWGQIGGSSTIDTPFMGSAMGRFTVGEDHYDRSGAPFSGQTIRWPAEIFTELNHGGVVVQPENQMPLGTIPDFFHTNIGDLTPGTVIVDDTENFLVVPESSKGGTLNTGNNGWLIRNPLL